MYCSYATSLVFQPRSIRQESDTSHLGLLHGFLDDSVLVGLGWEDNKLATIKLSLRQEILEGRILCDDE